MTEIFDLSPTDASNTSVTGESLNGAVANMGRMDNTLQAILGMFGRWTSSDTVASAGTTDIGAQSEAYLTISGATTITAFGTVRAGTMRFLRFSGALTLTHNATSLILPGGANITTAAGDTAIMVSEGSGNWRCLAYQRANGNPVNSPLKGHIYGLTLSNNGTDPTNDIDIAAGEAASTESSPVLMVLASGITKRLDAAWAVGTNQGGLDTGAIANTTYHVWLIRRSDTGVVDVLFSTSASSPTMPTNYDQKRRIGSIFRVSGAIYPFSQNEDEFLWVTPTTDISQNNPGTSGASYSLTVPTGIVVNALIRTTLLNGDATTAYALFRSTSETNTLPSGTLADISQVASAANNTGRASASLSIRTNSSNQIAARVSYSSANVTLYISTRGYIDTRGKE